MVWDKNNAALTVTKQKVFINNWESEWESTGSRGDVFVVRTSNPSKTSEKMGYFDRWSRYSFVKHSIYPKPRDWGLERPVYSALRASIALRATCCAPARLCVFCIAQVSYPPPFPNYPRSLLTAGILTGLLRICFSTVSRKLWSLSLITWWLLRKQRLLACSRGARI